MATVSGSGGGDPVPERVTRIRMTGTQRRQQLIEIGRALFAERGYEATSIEEIAQRANVSKPVVYEHFGGKEGLYARRSGPGDVATPRDDHIFALTKSLESSSRAGCVGFAHLRGRAHRRISDTRARFVRCRAQWDIFEPPQRRDQSGGLPVGGGLLQTRFRPRTSNDVRTGACRHGVHYGYLVTRRTDSVEGSCRRSPREFVLEWADESGSRSTIGGLTRRACRAEMDRGLSCVRCITIV